MLSGIEVTVWSGVVRYRGDCWSGVVGYRVDCLVRCGRVWSGIGVTVWSGVVRYRGDCLVRCGQV